MKATQKRATYQRTLVILYIVTLHGGPEDGAEPYCFRPYHMLKYAGHTYVARGPYEHQEHCQWVDDETRRIDLYYEPDQTSTESSLRARK